jgi:hypothetical protein
MCVRALPDFARLTHVWHCHVPHHFGVAILCRHSLSLRMPDFEVKPPGHGALARF